MLFNINLDTTSEYVCHKERWPKAVCEVMVDSLDMSELGHMLFGITPDKAFVDIFANIEPARRLVVSFLLMVKKEDGTTDEMKIDVTSLADSVEYYMTLERQGGEDFREFIAKSCIEIHGEKAEHSGCLVDVVNDFLVDKNVRIPSSDAELIAEGEDVRDANGNLISDARICGLDYDELVNSFEETLRYSPQQELRDRLNALSEWATVYNPDELDFYTEVYDTGVTYKQLELFWGRTTAEHIKEFWEEHGIV